MAQQTTTLNPNAHLDTAAAPDARPLTGPGLLLRLEGLAVLIGAVALYAHLRGSGWTFALLLLAPDLAFVAYLGNARIGAAAYNAVHHAAVPVTLGLLAAITGTLPLALLALIWAAHIGMDRTVGYGFKYATSAKETHLGRV